MKDLSLKLLCVLIFFFSIDLLSQETKKKELIASCCTELGRCTGSSYCTACKNCSGCKHCSKNGGSCGVCSSVSNKVYRNNYSKKKSTSFSKIAYKLKKGNTLYVSIETLNLRKEPNSKSKILERLKKDAALIYLDKTKNWIKVKVKKTGLIGYVYGKYLY
ncbi:SH3 domain-containing protein [Polaribacter porphyrae]|nr:SH3 domain-containing protein [Polaribacter porphyrae]